MKDLSYPPTIFLSSRSDSNPETGKQPVERAAGWGRESTRRRNRGKVTLRETSLVRGLEKV